MVLADVNVLVYAHRQDTPRHHEYLGWLDQVLRSDASFGVCDLVVSGFLRVVTHPRVFRDPTPLERTLTFATSIRDHPNAVTLVPGERHWDIVQRLCRKANAKGNLIPDAYLARLPSRVARNGLPPIETMPNFLVCDGGTLWFLVTKLDTTATRKKYPTESARVSATSRFTCCRTERCVSNHLSC